MIIRINQILLHFSYIPCMHNTGAFCFSDFFMFVYFCSLLMCLAVRGCIGRYLPYQTNPRLSTSTLPHKPYSLPSSAQDIWWWCISYYQTQSRIYMEFFKIDFISTLLHKPNTLSHLFLWVFDDDTRNIIKCNRKFKTRIFWDFYCKFESVILFF